ncbi:hypothetical protein [uncultured Roseobacter sp.]|uniref:hypothetical protein n=1 Tax=uncultured Roseobacter sp. TaxID=114847 RepID=UPI002636A26C|nr:hypothetical protein [uncultured Roseobacter sp.]
MQKMTITAEKDYDLREVYDRILDGELENLVDLDGVHAGSGGTTVFAAGSGRLPEITISLKEHKSDAEIAKIQAALREMFGTQAHIHIST